MDVESVFGHLKAYLHFTRFTVRGNSKVEKQMGFALMAMNMGKLACQFATFFAKERTKIGNQKAFQSWFYYYRGFVTTPCVKTFF
ncbi:transposase [Lacticaseibacillus pabuli]|uniref:Transposase n=1 Tax=Lacticaseibacillus pabuli TaxID=3025672 RepID=A0ABY7WVG7_9LACO|nr:transposase [Lacticaseibacillus sp. KACC 23028]WDF83801.1 transposase [Lacticaseibacillus sp. KACC 23028]